MKASPRRIASRVAAWIALSLSVVINPRLIDMVIVTRRVVLNNLLGASSLLTKHQSSTQSRAAIVTDPAITLSKINIKGNDTGRHCSSSGLWELFSMSTDFWAGYLSGAIGIIIGNPLDVVKVRLQAGGVDAAGSTSRTIGSFESVSSLVRGSLALSQRRT